MCEGQMNTIALCISMYFKVDKGQGHPRMVGGLDLAQEPPAKVALLPEQKN